jgi:protein TonB
MPPAPIRSEASAILPHPVASKPPPRPRNANAAKPPPRREALVQPRGVKAERTPHSDSMAARLASAPPPSLMRAALSAAAPASSISTSSASALASWKGAMLAHINRFKRYPPGASGVGTAYVMFTINGAGVVTSARLISSSGDAALDGEAVALLHRASPTPPPPGGAALTLRLPIVFNRS